MKPPPPALRCFPRPRLKIAASPPPPTSRPVDDCTPSACAASSTMNAGPVPRIRRRRVRSAGRPNRCVGTMASRSGSSNARASEADSKSKVRGSTSMSTGRSPALTTAAGTEKQVYAGMATERPGRNDFSACSSSVRAALPLDKRNVCRTPRYSASSVSIVTGRRAARRDRHGARPAGRRRPRERPSAAACVPASRDVPHNRWPNQSRQADRQTLPDVDRHPVLRDSPD